MERAGCDSQPHCSAVLQMYLTDVEEGGETVFPDVPKLPDQTSQNGWTLCGMVVSSSSCVTDMHSVQ
jgi:hypothetical protein